MSRIIDIHAKFEFWVAIAVLLILAALAAAQSPISPSNAATDKKALPAKPMVEHRIEGLPPVVAVVGVESVDKNKVRLRLMIIHSRVEEREAECPKGKYTYLHVVNTLNVVKTEIDYDSPSALRGTEIFDLTGKRVDPVTFMGKLNKGGTPVLVSYAGLVDPFFLRVAKEGTFVIVLGTRDDSEAQLRKIMHSSK